MTNTSSMASLQLAKETMAKAFIPNISSDMMYLFTTVPHPHGYWQLQELLKNIQHLYNMYIGNPVWPELQNFLDTLEMA